jgi:hypothetical protein
VDAGVEIMRVTNEPPREEDLQRVLERLQGLDFPEDVTGDQPGASPA